MDNKQEMVLVGQIGPARGLVGEVMIRPFTDYPEERFAVGNVLFDEEGYAWEITRFRVIKNRYCVTFAGVDNRNLAEEYRGFKLYAPEIDTTAEDEYSRHDLMGLQALGMTGNNLGEVTDLILGAAQDILVVKEESGNQVMVPFVKDLVPEINISEKWLRLNPPAGLFSSDTPSTLNGE